MEKKIGSAMVTGAIQGYSTVHLKPLAAPCMARFTGHTNPSARKLELTMYTSLSPTHRNFILPCVPRTLNAKS